MSKPEAMVAEKNSLGRYQGIFRGTRLENVTVYYVVKKCNSF